MRFTVLTPYSTGAIRTFSVSCHTYLLLDNASKKTRFLAHRESGILDANHWLLNITNMMKIELLFHEENGDSDFFLECPISRLCLLKSPIL